MKRTQAWLICLATLLLSGPLVEAAGQDLSPHPFSSIAVRNPFHLASPRRAIENPPPPTIATITLTGTTSILGDRRALLKVRLPATSSEPAREEWLVLAEGQTHGQITVLEVNEKEGAVKVNNYGTVMTVTFEKDRRPDCLANARQGG
jgi:hypothetical protein